MARSVSFAARRARRSPGLHGTLAKRGAFCELYEVLVRYALRLIADGREYDFLWDNWDNATHTVFDAILP